MKEMIKKYKGTLICSVLVMLAGILVGFTMAQSIWIKRVFCSDRLYTGDNHLL